MQKKNKKKFCSCDIAGVFTFILLLFTFANTDSTTCKSSTKVISQGHKLTNTRKSRNISTFIFVSFMFLSLWRKQWSHVAVFIIYYNYYYYLITVCQQQIQDPQWSQTSFLHTESWQPILLKSVCLKRGRCIRVWSTSFWAGMVWVQILAEARQVEVQQWEEEDCTRTWPKIQKILLCFF